MKPEQMRGEEKSGGDDLEKGDMKPGDETKSQ
jgi:hypothetical protein